MAEAARLCRVKKPNFLRDFASQPDFPEPVAELASGRIWWRTEIEAFLDKTAVTSSKAKLSGVGRDPGPYQVMATLLAADELLFRHNALTYFSSRFVHGGMTQPPTIEEVTLQSMEEDRRVALQAQLGGVESYLEAAWALFDKYSPALESYLLGVLGSHSALSLTSIAKAIWVEALRGIQRGEYEPDSLASFSSWLYAVANRVLAESGIHSRGDAPLSSSHDPLQSIVQTTQYEKALKSHARQVERLESEWLVLEYLSDLTSDEISQFLSAASKTTPDRHEVVEAQRMLERRLREISTGANRLPRP